MGDLNLKVTDIRNLTEKIKRFELVAADGDDLPRFDAGAHINFHLPNNLHRSYSLANDPAEEGRYVTAILREPEGGGGSLYMHDRVSVGDVLPTTPPVNQFPLDETAGRHVLLAGGIGITPLLAMGYRLKATGADYHLHYCTRSREETAFLEEVEQVFAGHLTFHHDGGVPADGINLIEEFRDQPDGVHLYICGPSGLIRAAREAASHWRAGTVHFELFSSAKTQEEKTAEAQAQGEDFEFEVELAQSGVTLTIPPDKSILDVLLENDTMVMYTCLEGWCGNCVVGLLEGEADHRDEILDDEDRKDKMQVCVSRAKPGQKLILDL